MSDYERINNEIHRLLNLNNNEKVQGKTTSDEIHDQDNDKIDYSTLESHLGRLVKLYDEINTYLQSGDKDGLKDALLKEEVKASLVCESLIKVLKDVCREKQEINKKFEEQKSKYKKVEMEKDEFNNKIKKLESEISFLKSTNEELARVIKDQKYLVSSTKEKSDLEKRNSENLKNINKELEMLKNKAIEKCNVFEKELKILKERLNEKENIIRNLNKEKLKEEKNVEAQVKKIQSLENAVDSYKKKIEAKERSLDLCNSELVRVIAKNKRSCEELENLRDKAAYYERLYMATNKQNEYLNEQLAKMINMDNVKILESPPNTVSTSHSDVEQENAEKSEEYLQKIKKYKRKYYNVAKEIEKLKENINNYSNIVNSLKSDNLRLKDEKTKAIDSNNKIINTLMNKVEYLLEKNKEYQQKIYKIDFKNADESFKTVDDGEDANKLRENKHFENDYKFISTNLDKNEDKGQNLFRKSSDIEFQRNKHYEAKDLENHDICHDKGKDDFIGNNLTKLNFEYPSYTNYQPYNEENNKNDIIPSFKKESDNFIPFNNLNGIYNGDNISNTPQHVSFKPTVDSFGAFKPFNLENEYDDKTQGVKESADKNYTKWFSKLNVPFKFIHTSRNEEEQNKDLNNNEPTNYGGISKMPEDAPIIDDFKIDEDNKSLESSKTIKTSNSLKNMIQKTTDLQRKFDDLEKQLEDIKNSDEPPEQKLQDQIKAYTEYYYSDYLDLSNENDVI